MEKRAPTGKRGFSTTATQPPIFCCAEQLMPNRPVIRSIFVHWLPLLACCTIIIYHFWYVSSYAINVPHHDGIYDFLRFVNAAEDTRSVKDGFLEWFTQYNDHRTNASRLAVYTAYLIEGEVNFHTLTLLANLALPLILLLIYVAVRREEYRWIILLVSTFFLLNLRSFTLVLWSQAAFAYYYVFLYGFACLFVLHKVTWPKLLLAAFLCTLSTFSLGSGQLVWLLGLASLIHQWLVTKRRPPTYAAIWLAVAVIMLLVWRIDFFVAKPETIGGIPIDQIHDLHPQILFGAPLNLILSRFATFFLVSLGSAFTTSSTVVAVSIGLALLSTLLFITFKSYKNDDIRLVLCCWFVVASAAAITYGRSIVVPPSYVLSSRYSFISVVLICMLAPLVQMRFALFKRTTVTILVVLLAGSSYMWTYSHFEGRLQKLLGQRHAAFNRQHFPVYGFHISEPNEIVRQAIAAGIYKPPCRPLPQCELAPPQAE
jgi:hypothetical protein